jgi:hypothetical protein
MRNTEKPVSRVTLHNKTTATEVVAKEQLKAFF